MNWDVSAKWEFFLVGRSRALNSGAPNSLIADIGAAVPGMISIIASILLLPVDPLPFRKDGFNCIFFFPSLLTI